jgi:hypothetical protein
MILYFVQFLFLFSIIAGILICVYAYVGSRKIYSGEEKSNRRKMINILFWGLSMSFITFSMLLLAGLIDKSHIWHTKSVYSAILISLIPGVFVILGVTWSYFVTGKFRDYLFKKLPSNKQKK